MSFTEFAFHTTLIESGERIPYVYFLEEGVASVMLVLPSGSSVEVNMIDRRGVIGAPPIFDRAHSVHRVTMLTAGTGYRMKSSLLAEQAVSGNEWTQHLFGFAYLYGVQLSQIAACNCLHHAEQRVSRWLLMMDDRTPSGDMMITHKFLSLLLGARRSTISLATKKLQRAGLIGMAHGHIQIADRPRLERAACECYATLRQPRTAIGRAMTR